MPSSEDIKESFANFEKEGQSVIPKVKVGSALRCLDIAVTDAELSEVLSLHKGTTIDFNTYNAIVTDISSKPLRDKSSVLSDAISMFLHGDQSSVNIQDLRQALNQIGEKIDDVELDEFFQDLELDTNGNISIAKFKERF